MQSLMRKFFLLLTLLISITISGLGYSQTVPIYFEGHGGIFGAPNVDAKSGTVVTFVVSNQSGKSIAWEWNTPSPSGTGVWTGGGKNGTLTLIPFNTNAAAYSVSVKIWYTEGEGGDGYYTMSGNGNITQPSIQSIDPASGTNVCVVKGSENPVTVNVTIDHQWSKEPVRIEAGSHIENTTTPSSGVATASFLAGSWTAGEYDVKAKLPKRSDPEKAGGKIVVVGVGDIDADKDSACIKEDVTFTATTIPAGHEDLVTWSGGGTPATDEGGTFTTQWSTKGNKTVTALDKNFEITILCTILESWAEVVACSNLEQRPGDKDPNGCSIPPFFVEEGQDPNNPAGCEDTSFLAACNAHDECYQTCESNKESCDGTFYSNMLEDVCLGSPCIGVCSRSASTYYNAVFGALGLIAWKADQVLYCVCCD